MFALAQLPLPCLCGRTINFKNPKFLHQKVQTSASAEEPPFIRNMSVLDNPPLSADIFYGQPLIYY